MRLSNNVPIPSLTVVLLGAVGGALVLAQMERHSGGALPRLQSIAAIDQYAQGWPVLACHSYLFWTPTATGLSTATSFEFHWMGLLINAIVALALLAGTAASAHHWLSRPRKWYQVSVLEWLALTAVFGGLMCLSLNEPARSSRAPDSLYSPLGGLPWPVAAVLWFALGCTIFVAGRLAAQYAEWVMFGDDVGPVSHSPRGLQGGGRSVPMRSVRTRQGSVPTRGAGTRHEVE
jgi:hypothetical protein